MVTFLVTRFPSSSVNCSSVTDSPGTFLASSPWSEGVNMGGGVRHRNGKDKRGRCTGWKEVGEVVCEIVICQPQQICFPPLNISNILKQS